MARKYFGTDGIRGRVGEYPMSADFVLRLGRAAGRVFARQGAGSVLIGKDTRISGYMFESALEAGLSAAGVGVSLLGPMPTPAVAYLTKTFRANAGIVISASHNPYDDNGLKFFDRQGGKLSDQLEEAIERELEEPFQTVDSARLGKVTRITDAAGRYVEFCKSTFTAGVSLEGIRIALDCAHGATYQVAPLVFTELGAQVITRGVNPDGLNINLECGSMHPQGLQRLVVESQADFGLALDGDGDRVLMVDRRGNLIDGDGMLYIIATAYQRRGHLVGPVVGTLMSNFGLEQALQAQQIRFMRAQVGDRHVLEMMHAHGSQLGGEPSGHILCLDRTCTGDGIIAALQVVAAAMDHRQPLDELMQGLSLYPQVILNVQVEQPRRVAQAPAVRAVVEAIERSLRDQGRIVLRASGTEPVVRVMVEGEDAAQVRAYAEQVAEVVRYQGVEQDIALSKEAR